MNWLKQNLANAGLIRLNAAQALLILFLVSIAVFWVSFELLQVAALSLAAALATVGMLLELILVRARLRRKLIARLWPIVLDSLESAAASGMSITDALRDLAESAPEQLIEYFAELVRQLDAGMSLDSAHSELKQSLAEQQCDQTIEVMRLASNSGALGFREALQVQSVALRADLAVSGEVAAKQGWIVGTAKLALAAPWLIVAMLSMRPENAASYNSQQGFGLLIGGLLISAAAYRLIVIFSNTEVAPRVLA